MFVQLTNSEYVAVDLNGVSFCDNKAYFSDISGNDYTTSVTDIQKVFGFSYVEMRDDLGVFLDGIITPISIFFSHSENCGTFDYRGKHNAINTLNAIY